MGWCSAGAYFEPVADELIATGASDDTRYKVCKALISALQGGDWDTEGESLGYYTEDDAIVRAFRDCGIYTRCDDEYLDGDTNKYYSCELEIGHDGDHEEPDRSWRKGAKWSR